MNQKEKLTEATMKALQGKLTEAKPSALKKPKIKNRDIHYSAEGQPAWSEYAIPFDYTLQAGDYEGYIDDKKGNRYIVSASYDERDTGRLAGGTTYYYVYIAYGKHKITLESYRAVFSSNDGPGPKIIDDISEGMYLEDYLQKYINCITAVSNIPEDFNPEESSSYKVARLFIQEYVIKDNENYDERTEKQKGIDKKNEVEYVSIDNCYIYLEGANAVLARDCQANKQKYIGRSKYSYSQFTEIMDGRDIETTILPEGTKIVLLNDQIEDINNMLTTPSNYSFSFTPDDFKHVAIRVDLHLSNNLFKIYNGILKPVKDDASNLSAKIDVRYSYIYNRRENLGNCDRLDELEQQYNIGAGNYHGVSMQEIYKEIEKNILETEKRGVTEAVVEIVYDDVNNKLRARSNDGYHGDAWVQFPNNLRQQQGDKFRVDELVWNGKNYTIKGTPQQI